MSALTDIEDRFRDHGFERLKAPRPRDAAVLIPIVTDADGALSILFEVRSRKIMQGGEVCFPGGRVEDGEDPQETVVRETMEELKVERSDIEIISPLFIMNGISDSLIYSYLGSIKNYRQSFSHDEVENVFALSLEELMVTEPKQSTADFVFSHPDDFHYELVPGGRDYKWSRRIKNYYFYETPYGVIWGMTGEILHGFIEKLKGNDELTDASRFSNGC